jgi:RND family efflux transporter MFP subunit
LAGQPVTAPPRVKLWRVFAVGVLASLLVAAAFLAGLEPRWHKQAMLAEETTVLAVPTVTVVSPAPGKPSGGLLLPAEVKPWLESPIYARASGYLKRYLVDLGDRVEAGQLLAEIETPELAQELERARYELAQQEAALALAKTKADRSTRLVDLEAASQEEYDENQAGVSMKTAMVDAARANVRRLEELHGFARITAPFPGIITSRKTDVGDLITAGSAKEIFRLAQTNKLRVYVCVPQTHALRIAPEQTAELLIPEQPNQVFPARVTRTAGAISTDSRTLLTELEVDNSQGGILAGSFGQVRFSEARGQAPLTLPGNTLLFRAEGPQVGVVQLQGVVVLRSVKLGRDFGETVEILGGVGPADRVILNPSDSLADGASVRVEVAK